jgi:hypothetical protein
MAVKMYLVVIRWVDTPLILENVTKVDSLLTPLGDWIRFSGTSWLLRTERSSREIFNALSTFLKKGDSELIIRVDPDDYNGWAAKWVDDWIIGKR